MRRPLPQALEPVRPTVDRTVGDGGSAQELDNRSALRWASRVRSWYQG